MDLNNSIIYIDDYLIIMQNGKQDLIDYDGNILIDAIYGEIKFNIYGELEVLP